MLLNFLEQLLEHYFTLTGVVITAFAAIITAFLRGPISEWIKRSKNSTQPEETTTLTNMTGTFTESLTLAPEKSPETTANHIIKLIEEFKEAHKDYPYLIELIDSSLKNPRNIYDIINDYCSAGSWLRENCSKIIKRSIKNLKKKDETVAAKISDSLKANFESSLIFIANCLENDKTKGIIRFDYLQEALEDEGMAIDPRYIGAYKVAFK